jgi:glycerol kinase
MSRYLLAIDAGTSSNRAVLFDASARACASAQLEFPQLYPRPGWVEHDPEAIWGTVVQVIGKVLADSGIRAQQLAGIGITNQRETTLIWDRATGECIHHAIVWQDRRTADSCARLKAEGAEPAFIGKTGLRLDPYFSGTKIAWLLEHVDGARQRAEQGRLAFGTVDSFLLWRLTGGKVHSTDATNASRTLLFNIHTQDWDEELLRLLSVPRELLPEVHDCAADFGNADVGFLDAPVPICGMAGDQHAALIGQAGFADGLTNTKNKSNHT